jgi:predicted RNA-binding protein with PUA-like domain
MPTRQHWLIKSEPTVYPYSQLEKDGRTAWTGIRNFEARNHLRAMKKGDVALYYHTGDEKQIVGVARILGAATDDPTAPNENWAAVEVEAMTPLKTPVTLVTLKSRKSFAKFPLVARGRLSVAPVSAEEFAEILVLGKTRLRRG